MGVKETLIAWGNCTEKNFNEGEQVLQERFRTIDGPTVFFNIDTEGDKTRGAGNLFQYFMTRTEKAPLLRRRQLDTCSYR